MFGVGESSFCSSVLDNVVQRLNLPIFGAGGTTISVVCNIRLIADTKKSR
jgi:hypothetical protein